MCERIDTSFDFRTDADAAFLLAQAAKCRRLADAISESDMTAKLRELAVEYELEAGRSKRRLLAEAGRPTIETNLT